MDGSGEFFDALCRQLPLTVHAQVVRYPGDRPLGYSELTQWVMAALPEDDPFVLVAESFSGPVAIQVAAAQPAGLVGAVLCATFARNPRPLFSPLRVLMRWAPVRAVPTGLMARWLLGTEANAAWTERIRQALNMCSVAVLRERAREVLRVDVRGRLADVRVPVLYLQATGDRVVPAVALVEMQRSLPGIEVAQIEGPHFLLQTRPGACAEQIVRFCDHLSP
jgi:pimeloyl-ACP methyl ester carboxylesterase